LKYIDEFRDGEVAKTLAGKIAVSVPRTTADMCASAQTFIQPVNRINRDASPTA
jgi:hypothetical protein